MSTIAVPLTSDEARLHLCMTCQPRVHSTHIASRPKMRLRDMKFGHGGSLFPFRPTALPKRPWGAIWAERVTPNAEKNGMGRYKGTPGWVPWETIERVASENTVQKVDLFFNKRWIDKQMSSGTRITDIGEPAGYQPSPFYDMELERTGGYWNYFRDVQP
jgi:hypothetical protein